MPRDLTPEEARDEKIAELTEQHLAARLTRLRAGDKQLVVSVDESLSHALFDSQVMGRLIVLAVTDAAQAGAALASLIQDVVRVDAETDAIKEVERLERAAKDDFDQPEPPLHQPVRGPWRYAGRL